MEKKTYLLVVINSLKQTLKEKNKTMKDIVIENKMLWREVFNLKNALMEHNPNHPLLTESKIKNVDFEYLDHMDTLVNNTPGGIL